MQHHVARIGVGAQSDVLPRPLVALPTVEEAAAARDIDRAMRDRTTVLAHYLQIARARIIHQRIVSGKITVPDVERVGHEPDVIEQLDRGHLVFANDVEHFVDVVGRVDRHRHLVFAGGLGGGTHQVQGTGLDLARHDDAADKAAACAVVLADEIQREFEFALPARLFQHPDQLAALAGNPPAAIEAGA